MTTYWNVSNPLDILSRSIEWLQTMAQQANIPYTEKYSRRSDKLVTLRMHLKGGEKTFCWQNLGNFENHVRPAQQILEKIRGYTIQQSGYYHANPRTKNTRNDMYMKFDAQNKYTMTLHKSIVDCPSPIFSINIISQQNIQLEMLKLMREM